MTSPDVPAPHMLGTARGHEQFISTCLFAQEMLERAWSDLSYLHAMRTAHAAYEGRNPPAPPKGIARSAEAAGLLARMADALRAESVADLDARLGEIAREWPWEDGRGDGLGCA